MHSSDTWNIVFANAWRLFLKSILSCCFFLLSIERNFARTIFEVTFYKIIFFSTNIPVFLMAICKGRMYFIWPKQNASCWLRMASGGLAVTFVLPKDKIFCFLFNLNIPPLILFICLPNWKVLYFQRSNFKTRWLSRCYLCTWKLR